MIRKSVDLWWEHTEVTAGKVRRYASFQDFKHECGNFKFDATFHQEPMELF